MVALAGCARGPVTIDDRALGPAVARTCSELVADLPGTVGDRERVEVSPTDAPGAAWGDPAIVLTCGVPPPEGFTRTAVCQEADGVGWFVPDAALEDESIDVRLTAVGYRPRVELVVPAEQRPEGVAAAMATMAQPVKDHLEEVRPCL